MPLPSGPGQMLAFNLQGSVPKIPRGIRVGRGLKYEKTAQGLCSDRV